MSPSRSHTDTPRAALRDGADPGLEAYEALDALLADLQRLEEALRFYADPVSYENETPRHVRPVISDQGERARAALHREKPQ